MEKSFGEKREGKRGCSNMAREKKSLQGRESCERITKAILTTTISITITITITIKVYALVLGSDYVVNISAINLSSMQCVLLSTLFPS